MNIFRSNRLAVLVLATIVPSLGFAFKFSENFNGYEKFSNFHESSYNKNVNSDDPVIWQSGVRVKIVPLDGSIEGIDEGVVGSVTNPAVSISGQSNQDVCVDCALSFHYPGSSSLEEDAFAEQRFALNPEHLEGKKGLEEFWLQYDQYIPVNFHFRDTNPTSSNWFGGGEKVLSLFADKYSNPNPTLIIGRLLRRADRDDPVRRDSAYPDFTFSYQDPYDLDKRNHTGIRGNLDPDVRLIMPSVDKGYWQRRTLHVAMPSSADSNDGVLEFWVKRRVGEPGAYVEKLFDVNNGSFYGSEQNYINKGYLLGWSNSGYNEDVVFLIDNVIVSDDPSQLDTDAFGKGVARLSPPNAPSTLTVD